MTPWPFTCPVRAITFIAYPVQSENWFFFLLNLHRHRAGPYPPRHPASPTRGHSRSECRLCQPACDRHYRRASGGRADVCVLGVRGGAQLLPGHDATVPAGGQGRHVHRCGAGQTHKHNGHNTRAFCMLQHSIHQLRHTDDTVFLLAPEARSVCPVKAVATMHCARQRPRCAFTLYWLRALTRPRLASPQARPIVASSAALTGTSMVRDISVIVCAWCMSIVCTVLLCASLYSTHARLNSGGGSRGESKRALDGGGW